MSIDKLIVGVAIVALAPWCERASAQALDIGGIELRIGMDASDAQKALAGYNLQFDQQMPGWFVTQNVEDRKEWLGHFAAVNGRVSFISKGYQLRDVYNTRQVYTQAAQDVRRRGGTTCVAREVEYMDDLVHGFEMRCGAYKLVYSFPGRHGNDLVSPGISIIVGGK